MNKREIKKGLKSLIPQMEEVEDFNFIEEGYKTTYLGSFMSLDPCGKYHSILSPNGATNKCMAFWDRLNNAAEELGGWIEGGEGDPTDIFFSMPIDTND